MGVLSETLGWDPDAYPHAEPVDRRFTTLGLQPDKAWRRRAVPVRWLVHVDSPTGDFLNVIEPTPLTWTGFGGGLTPFEADNRRHTPATWLGLLTFNGTDADQIIAVFNWALNASSGRFASCILTLGDFVAWPTLTWDNPTIVGPNFDGNFSQLRIVPAAYFRDYSALVP